MSTEINRRQFLGRAAVGGAVAGLGLTSAARAQSPNDQIVVGVLGAQRGAPLARNFAQQDNCVVKYVCDVDTNRADELAGALDELTGEAPNAVQDFRRVYDDPDVDAVVLALPVHWHALGSIMALQADKHVYVEKPCCHSPREGELLVEAARHYGKAVQMGNQRRSWPQLREGMQRMHEGDIGRVYYARCWYASTRGPINLGEEVDPPEHLDYEMWQGPAPRRPYVENLIHYNWHWFWHWGTGEAGNNGVHAIDLARWGLGADYPIRVSSAGGRHRFDDDQETPDTHVLTFDFPDDKTMMWECLSCNQPGLGGTGFGATFYGEDGSLVIEGGRAGGYTILDVEGREVETVDGPAADEPHVEDFLTAIRNDAPLDLHSEIEEGYKSSLLPLLGNISHRVGRSLTCGEYGRIEGDSEAESYWEREYEPGWEPEV